MHPGERVRVSKLLSLVLRHDPARAGLLLDRAGWVDVAELLAGLRRLGRPLSLAELEEVVEAGGKRRFAFDPSGTRIRALQGHSVPVDLGYPPVEPPPLLWHGTTASALRSILREGLRPRGRHAVHLSPDVATARAVGARRGPPVILEVQAGRLHADGATFRVADNGVWLVEEVPPDYLAVRAVREESA